jgi:hypothetical protein
MLVALLLGLLAQSTATRVGSPVAPRPVCRTGCITATKTSATEWRIVTPVVSAPSRNFVSEWRFKTVTTLPVSGSGPIWSLQGVYGRDTTSGASDVTLTDGSSVMEYTGEVGVTDAASSSFDFWGNFHGGETLSAPITFALDAADITASPVGTVAYGFSLVTTQAKNFLLPKNGNGSANLSTIIGTGTTTHTFNSAGVLVTHTHTFSAGYQGFSYYAAMLPVDPTNFDQVSVNGGSAYTPVRDGSVQFTGTQNIDARAWHTSAHHFQFNMTLPSGGPAVPSDWTYAAPDKGYFIDNLSPGVGKFYVLYVNDTYATRQALNALGVTGTITQQQQYSVSWR